MILILFCIIIDCIGKSFNIGAWYASFPIAIVLIFYVLVMNYECKNILELSLVDRPNGYSSISFGKLTSLHNQALVHCASQSTVEKDKKGGNRARRVRAEPTLNHFGLLIANNFEKGF